MASVHYEISGSGSDLVLLHGWGLNLRVWDGLVRELRNRYRLIALDLPGHGKSPWSVGAGTPAEQAWVIHQALASLSARYSLLGWSIGAQIALDLAAATPAQVDKLILVAATPRFVGGADWPHGATPQSLARLAERLRANYRRTVQDFLELQVRGAAGGEETLALLRRALFEHGEAHPQALQAGLDRLASGDQRATLAHVHAPVLVIAGQYDRITLPAASRALAAAIGGARYVEMRRAAHAPFLSHPRAFAARVDEFLHPHRVGTSAAAARRKSSPRRKTRPCKKIQSLPR